MRKVCAILGVGPGNGLSFANRFANAGYEVALCARTLDVANRRPPGYPIAYDAGKALHAAAKLRGENGFGAHWAIQGAPLVRTMPAAKLVATLGRELQRC
jgi:NAD(P)-dependent dehydrogenase (short-subunit alcohol dehydrogenase family)